MISLDRSQMSAMGKCAALLWQLYLMFGPSFSMMLATCKRVRSLTTDQGVERLLPDMRGNLLHIFFRCIDPKCRLPAEEEDYLFPRCLAMPGWMHVWDLLIRKGLSSLGWFPRFLELLKALVAFLRSSTICSSLVRNMRARGYQGVAELLSSSRLPRFAEWRWKTLRTCCRRLLDFVDSLRSTFDVTIYSNLKDRVWLTKVMTALSSDSWRWQLDWVMWYTDWLGEIQSWAQGCSCHAAELLAGQNISCPQKGRRLREAYGFASASLMRGLEEANKWTLESWPCNFGAILGLQGCVRNLPLGTSAH